MSLIPHSSELGPVLDRWFDSWADVRPSSRSLTPATRAYVDDEGLVVRLEVPGVPPEALHVETRGKVLTIEAKAPEAETHNGYRPFRQVFSLPEEVDSERAEATHEYGVLTLRFPKYESLKPRRIEIQTH